MRLLAAAAFSLLCAGCAGVQLHQVRPTFELREKPPHTCSGWRECFGELWLGFSARF